MVAFWHFLSDFSSRFHDHREVGLIQISNKLYNLKKLMLKRSKCKLFQQMFTSWFERNLIKSYFFFPLGLLKMPFSGPKMWDWAKNYQSGNVVERFCTFSLSTCFMDWWKSYVFQILHTKNTHFPRDLSNLKALFISFFKH